MDNLQELQNQIDAMYGAKKTNINQIIHKLVIEFYKTTDTSVQENIKRHLKDTYSLILDPFNPDIIFGNENTFLDYKCVSNQIKKIKNKPERWSYYCKFIVGVGVCYVMVKEA